MNRGYWFAASAYAMWGLLPLYWQQIRGLSAVQIVAHRIVWSCVWIVPILLLTSQVAPLRKALQSPRNLAWLTLAACLVAANWLGFVWAVTHDRVLESSLGYFLCPLLSVTLAVVVLGERLRSFQWVSVSLASLGILYLTLHYGQIPWVALVLASSFCLYGFVKKTTPLHPVVSLAIETYSLLIPTLLFLGWCHAQGEGIFLSHGWEADGILIGGGLATTIPLLFFAAGAQRISLTAVGILQYIGPTLQFLVAIFINGEEAQYQTYVGFGLVWSALAIFVVEGLLVARWTRARPEFPQKQEGVEGS